MKKYLDGKLTEAEYKKKTLAIVEREEKRAIKALKKKPDSVFWYMNMPDLWGHLFFTDKKYMHQIYKRMNDFAKRVLEEYDPELMLIVSDHGMEERSGGGDHLGLDYAFYSCTPKLGLKKPSILDIYGLIKKISEKGVWAKKSGIKAGGEWKEASGKKELNKEEVKKRLQALGYM